MISVDCILVALNRTYKSTFTEFAGSCRKISSLSVESCCMIKPIKSIPNTYLFGFVTLVLRVRDFVLNSSDLSSKSKMDSCTHFMLIVLECCGIMFANRIIGFEETRNIM